MLSLMLYKQIIPHKYNTSIYVYNSIYFKPKFLLHRCLNYNGSQLIFFFLNKLFVYNAFNLKAVKHEIPMLFEIMILWHIRNTSGMIAIVNFKYDICIRMRYKYLLALKAISAAHALRLVVHG